MLQRVVWLDLTKNLVSCSELNLQIMLKVTEVRPYETCSLESGFLLA